MSGSLPFEYPTVRRIDPESLTSQRHDTSTAWSGSRILEDLVGLRDAIEHESWVEGVLNGVALAADTAAAFLNPLGELLASGVGWLIEHVWPLNSWLDELTGDAGRVTTAAQTWSNVSVQLQTCADDLRAQLSTHFEWQKAATISAFLDAQNNCVQTINAASSVASAVSTGLSVASMLVQFVHDMVRDAIADIIGYGATLLVYEAASLGLATPYVIAEVLALAAKWVTRLSSKLAALIRSFGNLGSLIRQVSDKIDEAASAVGRIAQNSPWASRQSVHAFAGGSFSDDLGSFNVQRRSSSPSTPSTPSKITGDGRAPRTGASDFDPSVPPKYGVRARDLDPPAPEKVELPEKTKAADVDSETPTPREAGATNEATATDPEQAEVQRDGVKWSSPLARLADILTYRHKVPESINDVLRSLIPYGLDSAIASGTLPNDLLQIPREKIDFILNVLLEGDFKNAFGEGHSYADLWDLIFKDGDPTKGINYPNPDTWQGAVPGSNVDFGAKLDWEYTRHADIPKSELKDAIAREIGFANGLPEGQNIRIDRLGHAGGAYFGAIGPDGIESFSRRSITPDSLLSDYTQLEINLDALPDDVTIRIGTVEAAYGFEGGAKQLQFFRKPKKPGGKIDSLSMKELIEKRVLVPVETIVDFP